jgi:hypothetical protein
MLGQDLFELSADQCHVLRERRDRWFVAEYHQERSQLVSAAPSDCATQTDTPSGLGIDGECVGL